MNHNPCVYIIDSSSAYRRITGEMLRALDYYNVHSFVSAEQCFENAPSTADIVILDFNLNKYGKNGLEFMRKYHRKHPQTSFIFLSSNSKLENAVDCIKSGAVDYIIKSKSGLERLMASVDKIYNNKISLRRSLVTQKAIMIAIGICTTTIAIASWMYTH